MFATPSGDEVDCNFRGSEFKMYFFASNKVD